MTQISTASLIDRTGLDRVRLKRHLARGFEGADDGELFLEYRQSEALVFDNGRLKQATYDTAQGFGLRAVKADAVGYAHASDLSDEALARAAEAVRAVRGGYSGSYAEGPARTNVRLYGDENPLGAPSFEVKVKLLETIDAYARTKDPRVKQVSVSFGATWQVVEIVRADGGTYRDIRPLVRINVSVVAGSGNSKETGTHGYGGREGYEGFLETGAWQWAVDEAVRQGLEGDFNRRGTSAFAGLMGERVAAQGVTVVDDGTMPGRRGSLSIDDEGTATNRTVLIEDGILVGYIQDRQNARLMNMRPTGNGRRQSYAHVPMPRMTNTYMLAGGRDPAEILASVKNGIYAVSFGGGQVDITSGKFVFQCTEAYRLETGIGTCGKNGQGVPVGVGQPTLRIDRVTVGGTG